MILSPTPCSLIHQKLLDQHREVRAPGPKEVSLSCTCRPCLGALPEWHFSQLRAPSLAIRHRSTILVYQDLSQVIPLLRSAPSRLVWLSVDEVSRPGCYTTVLDAFRVSRWPRRISCHSNAWSCEKSVNSWDSHVSLSRTGAFCDDPPVWMFNRELSDLLRSSVEETGMSFDCRSRWVWSVVDCLTNWLLHS
jgi:hypothetical protein